jgi:hypothetical protein
MYLILGLIISHNIFAQSFVSRVLVLNEGYFDYITNDIIVPVTVGAYDPATGVYTTIQTVEGARFASDILIDGDYYYVAADHYLLQYDLNTNALVHMADVPGIRQIAVDDDQIVVTRGEYLVTLPSYLQVYDKATLSLDYEIAADVLPHTTEGVIIKDGKAYVAVNNGFVFGAEVGYIAVLDLTAESITATIDLGADGINPDNLMIDGDDLYTLNNKDFTGSSVSSYKIGTGDITTTNLANISSGCGTSAISSGTIYYQELFGTTLSKFDPLTTEITGEDEYGISFYGLAFDPIDDIMYTSETDYFSYGRVHLFATDGTPIATFDASVSPGNFAFDVRLGSAIDEVNANEIVLEPNPATFGMHATADFIIESVRITDMRGVVCYTSNGLSGSDVDLDVSALPAGQYTLQLTGATGTTAAMFVKQ